MPFNFSNRAQNFRESDISVIATFAVKANIDKPGSIINMAIGNPTHHISKAAESAIENRLNTPLTYGPFNGDQEVRTIIANYVNKRYRVDNKLEDKNVVMTEGISMGIFHSLALSTNSDVGDKVVVLAPAYTSYRTRIQFMQAEMKIVASSKYNNF